MFIYLLIVSVSILLLGSNKSYHAKSVSLIICFYCFFMVISVVLTNNYYLILSTVLIVVCVYYVTLSDDVVHSSLFILPPLLLKIYQVCLVTGVINKVVIPTQLIFKTDYLLVSSVLLLLVLDTTTFKFNTLEIKDIRALLICSIYTYCITSILF